MVPPERLAAAHSMLKSLASRSKAVTLSMEEVQKLFEALKAIVEPTAAEVGTGAICGGFTH